MKPETAFVTALAAGNTKGLLSALAAGPDWELVGELAASHQVDALCWWMWRNRINKESDPRFNGLSDFLLDRLRKSYLHHLLRNDALFDDLAVLQKTFRAHGVEVLYFKGPWMVLHAYPDPGTRPVNDIDLCVREKQYLAAVAALESAGWRTDEAVPSTASEALTRSHYRKQLRFSAEGRRTVELHFRLVNVGPPASEESWLWDGAREVVAGACTLRVPGPGAMLLHLMLHANQHGFAMLRLLHDIRWFLEGNRDDLNMAALYYRVRALRCQASCYYALQLAEELANAAVPSALLVAFCPSAARRAFFTSVWRLKKVRRLEAPGRQIETESPIFYLFEMGRVREKARFIARVIHEAGGLRRLVEETRRSSSKSAPPAPKIK